MGEEELGNMHFDVELDVLEEEATEVGDDGTVVTEHVAAIADPDTGIAIVDSLVEITTAEGAHLRGETLSVIDQDGNVEVIESAAADDDI